MMGESGELGHYHFVSAPWKVPSSVNMGDFGFSTPKRKPSSLYGTGSAAREG